VPKILLKPATQKMPTAPAAPAIVTSVTNTTTTDPPKGGPADISHAETGVDEFDPGSESESETENETVTGSGSKPAEAGHWSDSVQQTPDDAYYAQRATELSSSDVTVDAVLSQMENVHYERYPDDKPAAVAKISHCFDNFNRSIEAVLGTDAVLVDRSCAYLRGEGRTSVHTRMFEAVGDYIPNLILRGPGGPEALNPKWVAITNRTGSHRLVDMSHAPRKGYARYRLVNGKFADLRVGKQTPPPFVNFPPFPELAGFRVAGVLVDLEAATLLTVPRKPLSTPGELFDEAVSRAGGVNEVAILPYHSLHPEALPDSKFFQAWLQRSQRREPAVNPPPVASYRQALLLTMKALKEMSDEDGADPLVCILDEMINDSMSEEEAESIYHQTMSFLPTQHQEALDLEKQPGPTGMYRYLPEPADVDEWTLTTLPYTVAGEELLVEARVSARQDMRMPYPAFLAPDRASTSATAVLARQATLGDRFSVGIADFHISLPWYALSVTPRRQDEKRGVMSDGSTWFERMQADVHYYGPYFFSVPEDEEATRWADIFNTVWLEELLTRGRLGHTVEIWRWAGDVGDVNASDVPMHARGIGAVGGRLVLSPLVQVRQTWRESNALDSRARFPREVLELVLDHPDIFSVVNAQDYLNHLSPLKIAATIKGETVERFHSDEMAYDPKAETAALAFLTDIHSVTTFDEGGIQLKEQVRSHNRRRSMQGKAPLPLSLSPQRLPARPKTPTQQSGWSSGRATGPVLPPANKKLKETTNQEWGIPDDMNASGWKAKVPPSKVPFSEVEVFSSSIVVTSPGNWNAIGLQLKAAGVSEDTIKHHYSVHWHFANGGAQHPVIQYHNPIWTETLVGKPVIRERWYWPTAQLAPHPWLSTNMAGQEALYGPDAARHKKKLRQSQVPTRGRGGGLAPRGGTRGRGYGSNISNRSNWPSAASTSVDTKSTFAVLPAEPSSEEPNTLW
jgi:hypothetical protein